MAHEGLGYLNQLGKALGLKFAAAEGDGRLFGGCRHLGCPCHIRRIGSQAGIPKALCLTYGAHNVAYLAHKHVIFEPGYELVDKLHGRGQITGGSVCAKGHGGVFVSGYGLRIALQCAGKYFNALVLLVVQLVDHFTGGAFPVELLLLADYVSVERVKLLFEPVIGLGGFRVHHAVFKFVHYFAHLGCDICAILHHFVELFHRLLIPPKFLV